MAKKRPNRNTPLAKWESIMGRLEYRLEQEEKKRRSEERTKDKSKKSSRFKNNKLKRSDKYEEDDYQ